MAQLSFDTLAFVKRLTAAGMNVCQAGALAGAVSDHVFRELATKSDLKKLESRLTMRFGAMLAACTAVTVAILGTMGGS